MSFRELLDADLPSITRIAQRGWEFDWVDEALLREKTTAAKDNDSQLGLVWEEDGKVVAFVQGAMAGQLEGRTKGAVRVFGVDRAYRRRGIASALFDEIENRLRSSGAQVITMMDIPANYLTPGIDFRYTEAYCFLLKRGYTVFRENHNLRCRLNISDWPELDNDVAHLNNDGLEIRRATPSDREAIIALLEQEWKGWIPEVTSALENDPAGIYICLQNGEVLAFSGFQGNNKSLPFFGPMGTSPRLRGRGVGGILLRLCLRDLARQGWDYAIIPWVGPVSFYSRYCGAWLDRCFWAYRKDI